MNTTTTNNNNVIVNKYNKIINLLIYHHSFGTKYGNVCNFILVVHEVRCCFCQLYLNFIIFIYFNDQASHQHFKPFLNIGNKSYMSEDQNFKLVYYCILIYVVWT